MLCSQNMSMNADLLCAQRIIELDYILDCCMKLHLECDTYESCGSDDVIMRSFWSEFSYHLIQIVLATSNLDMEYIDTMWHMKCALFYLVSCDRRIRRKTCSRPVQQSLEQNLFKTAQ
jgi:hypothetical protein